MLDAGDLADMDHPLVVLDDPVQVGNTHVLVFFCIRYNGPVAESGFFPA